MKPMALVAWGFVVVVLDFRIDQLDLLHDLVGWGMCLAGLVAARADLLNPPNGWLVTTVDADPVPSS